MVSSQDELKTEFDEIEKLLDQRLEGAMHEHRSHWKRGEACPKYENTAKQAVFDRLVKVSIFFVSLILPEVGHDFNPPPSSSLIYFYTKR